MIQHSPFAHLQVPNRSDEDLSQEEVDRLVKPFYMTSPDTPSFATALGPIYAELDEDLVRRLLSFMNWRPKVAGAYFAAIKNLVGLEELIGSLLLRSDVCYAGDAYCKALARFNTPASRQVLKTYLDYYLTRPDLWYDQGSAIGALAYLDQLNGRADVEEYRERWQAFVSDKSWVLEEQISQFAATMAVLLSLEATRLTLARGDITRQRVDVIVNAANSSLLGGGGVDGAIHRAGGPQILDDCRAIRARQGGCPTGHAVITRGGNLPARFVIHTVGPVWQGGGEGEPELLANCYRNSLQLALDKGLTSLAFPCISTGVYGYPPALAATVAVQTVRTFVEQHRGPREVRFVVYLDNDEVIYRKLLNPSV